MNQIRYFTVILMTLVYLGCAYDTAEHSRQPQPGNNPLSDMSNEQREPLPANRVVESDQPRDERKFELEAGAVAQEMHTGSGAKVKNRSRSTVKYQPQSVAAERLVSAFPHTPPQIHPDPYFGPEPNAESYRHREQNPVRVVAESPVSTFSIDVDTGSYANTRRFLQGGSLPHRDSVRAEEFINYFRYQYPLPASREVPFSLYTEVAPSPWNGGKHLLHIGLRGYEVPKEQLPPANLVFLIDVSGSMRQSNKLPLLKTSLNLLAGQLGERDRVSIVVYAGAAGVVLEPVAGNDGVAISAALNRLQAGGSTNGGAGIELAYAIARKAFIEQGINRVILATDGDFNVGVASPDALKRMVERQRRTGISLTTLGFGQGNYKDALMNELAEIGDGNAAYIDTALEARKVLVDEVSSTLFTIARDVKIQIEFSPRVQEYRLVGYESRMLKREDFNNDAKDAGEIGAGHTVTALYEITLAGSDAASIEPLRYGKNKNGDSKTLPHSGELAYLKLRYKLPGEGKSRLLEQPVVQSQVKAQLSDSSDDFRFSAAVAAFAQIMQDTAYAGQFGYRDVLALARGAVAQDASGYRNEFLNLVKMAETLEMSQIPAQPQQAGLR